MHATLTQVWGEARYLNLVFMSVHLCLVTQVQHLGWLMLVLPLNGILNFGQNIVSFSMISAVSPVSYSVANATKRIVIIGFSLLLLRNPVSLYNVCGMAMAVIGVAIYNKVRMGYPSLAIYNKVRMGYPNLGHLQRGTHGVS